MQIITSLAEVTHQSAYTETGRACTVFIKKFYHRIREFIGSANVRQCFASSALPSGCNSPHQDYPSTSKKLTPLLFRLQLSRRKATPFLGLSHTRSFI